MRMAVFVGNRKLEWAWEAALSIERDIGFKLDAAERDGMAFVLPKEDCGMPATALEHARSIRSKLAGVGDGFVRPIYVWRDGHPPLNIEDAYATVFDENILLKKQASAQDDLFEGDGELCGEFSRGLL